MGDLGIAVALVEVCRRLLFNNHQRPCSIIHTPMSVKISPKLYDTIARKTNVARPWFLLKADPIS